MPVYPKSPAAHPVRPSPNGSWWTRTARSDMSAQTSRYLPPNRGHPSPRLIGKSMNDRARAVVRTGEELSRRARSNASLLAASAALGGDLGSPSFDLWPKPELHTAVAELANGARHVRVAMLIHAHRVAVGEAEKLGDTVRVEEIVNVYLATHHGQITAVFGSVRVIR